jgi:hypothetical protein
MIQHAQNNAPGRQTLQQTYWVKLADAISGVWSNLLNKKAIIWPCVTYGRQDSTHYFFESK